MILVTSSPGPGVSSEHQNQLSRSIFHVDHITQVNMILMQAQYHCPNTAVFSQEVSVILKIKCLALQWMMTIDKANQTQ
jgi:hypothetical protein